MVMRRRRSEDLSDSKTDREFVEVKESVHAAEVRVVPGSDQATRSAVSREDAVGVEFFRHEREELGVIQI